MTDAPPGNILGLVGDLGAGAPAVAPMLLGVVTRVGNRL
jgi:hypothetical protein